MIGEIDVEAINLGRRQALLSTGAVVNITQFFDEDGDETNDPEFALAMVIKLPDGRWWTGDVSSYCSGVKH